MAMTGVPLAYQRLHESTEDQRQEVEAVVDHIELICFFEEKRYVEGFPYFGV